MGCLNSKTKKAKERDTLSQEGARETAKELRAAADDELLSRQNTSAQQDAGMQSRDAADQLATTAAQDPETLEVPVPHRTGDLEASKATASLVEDVVDTTAKPDDARNAENTAKDTSKHKSRDPRDKSTSSSSFDTPDRMREQTTRTTSSKADQRRPKNKKDDRHDRHNSGRSAESASEGESVRRSDAKKKAKRDRKAHRSPNESSRGAKSNGSPRIERLPSVGALSHPQTRLTSTSGGSLSFEFQSDAEPPVVPIALHPSASVGAGSVVVSSTPRSASRISSRGRGGKRSANNFMGNTLSTPLLVNEAAADGLGKAPVMAEDSRHSFLYPSAPAAGSRGAASNAATTADASRLSYEPYTDFGPRDGDDALPPYEWVPRTMPLPSPLRHGGATSLADIEGGAAAQRIGGTYEVAAEVSYGEEAPRSRWAHAVPPGSFYDLEEDPNDGSIPPLVPRTFYPHLPPVQWPSYASPLSATATSAPQPPRPSYDNAAETSVSVDESVYDDTHALYSPADDGREGQGRRRPHPTESRVLAAPPFLVDAYMSEDDEDVHGVVAKGSGTPSPVFPPPKISILPSPYAYGPSPMLSVNADAYGSYLTGRTGNGHRTQGGVGAHQYKPVSYLFDNSMDNWLQARRTTAPQRELYADAAGLW